MTDCNGSGTANRAAPVKRRTDHQLHGRVAGPSSTQTLLPHYEPQSNAAGEKAAGFQVNCSRELRRVGATTGQQAAGRTRRRTKP